MIIYMYTYIIYYIYTVYCVHKRVPTAPTVYCIKKHYNSNGSGPETRKLLTGAKCTSQNPNEQAATTCATVKRIYPNGR